MAFVLLGSLIDAGSSAHSLSTVKTGLRTCTALEITQWLMGIISTHVCAPLVLAMATIRGQRLFHLELPIVYYSRVATIRGRRLIEETQYSV